ncbi:hypothetical protein BTO10_02700 [Vibrio chagasii]|uniref:Uncharacterized protein n=1 Tax=Vibrio chagasii TaxID=170679 RepID=A0A2S7VPJ5_9VIBR|nr:hypothetical protein [Vibrio chagasii]PQJ63742.1 hypothetical protein BTO10_02700 [Vibrio chagasii]
MNTNFAAIGQLVTEARNLLDSIKGGAIRTMQTQFDALKSSMQRTFDSKLASFDAQVATATKPTADLTAKFMLSKNVRALELIANSDVPSGWAFRSQANVEEQLLIEGSKNRHAIQNSMLAELQNDIRKVYPTFNGSVNNYIAAPVRAIRVTWDFSNKAEFTREHIIIPRDMTSGSSLYRNQIVTHAAFVKCISGEISLQNNAIKTVGTTWTWLRQLYSKTARLGDYIHPCLIAQTPVGEAWILLAGHAAGNITDPNDWMGLPEL